MDKIRNQLESIEKRDKIFGTRKIFKDYRLIIGCANQITRKLVTNKMAIITKLESRTILQKSMAAFDRVFYYFLCILCIMVLMNLFPAILFFVPFNRNPHHFVRTGSVG